MTTQFQSMNGCDFLSFMNHPNSLTSIIEEYYSIIFKEKGIGLNQNEDKCKIKCCMQLMRYLHRSTGATILNASFIDGYDVKRKYICMKSPQEDVCDKFWQTAWDHNVQIIVMTCRLSDKKSYQYWSPKEGCVIVCSKFQIKTLKIKVNRHYNITLLSLINQSGKKHKILHYQYTAWPTDDFSHQPDAFIDFLLNVKMSLNLERQRPDKKPAPIIVLCPDGVSSSAVFCVFDNCVTEFDKTGTLSIPSILTNARQQKYGFMNRLGNYVLCYQLVGAYIEKKLSTLPLI